MKTRNQNAIGAGYPNQDFSGFPEARISLCIL